MGWNVVLNGAPTSSVAVITQCATLFNNAVPGMPAAHQISPAKLDRRLTPDPGPNQYMEPNEQYARELFRLHIWSNDGQPDDNGVPPVDATTIQIALAFHLTLKRSVAGTPTTTVGGGSVPTRRWWALTVGCRQAVAGPDLYPIIKPRLVAFYNNMRANPPECLVILNDAAWVPPAAAAAAATEVEHLHYQMMQDPDIALAPILAHAAYGPYAQPAGAPICPNGIKGVRIVYSPNY
jgi:hypothetical protein